MTEAEKETDSESKKRRERAWRLKRERVLCLNITTQHTEKKRTAVPKREAHHTQAKQEKQKGDVRNKRNRNREVSRGRGTG